MSEVSQNSSSENLEFKSTVNQPTKPVPKYQQNLKREVTYNEFKQMQAYTIDKKATQHMLNNLSLPPPPVPCDDEASLLVA